MYLSTLLINVGSNPDRPRPGRLWLRNLYHVHQRLCMAFPSASRVSADADYLKPFKPEDFCREQVHITRGPDAGFLFRIDPQPGGRVVILVQSALKPDWDCAFRNAGYLLVARPEVKSFAPCFAEGQRLRFRLVANTTRKVDTKSGPDGRRRNGRRVPVPPDQLYDWLARRAEAAGFSVDMSSTTVQPACIYVNKQWTGGPCDRCGGRMKEAVHGKEIVCDQCGIHVRLLRQRLRSVRYDGVLRIADPARFQEALACGIGPAKAFGFGLLSIAPLRN